MKTINARFVRTAANARQFIQDGLPQVAFAGRSNVGKSSIINSLLGRNDIARVGASPGKTTNINYYLIDEKFYFVDLPGFGFAKRSKSEKERWAALMEEYFNRSGLMNLGVQLVDIRHEPMDNDIIMTQWFRAAGVRFILVANKSDKIKSGEVSGKLEIFRNVLELPAQTPLIAYSAQNGTGRQELMREILDGCR